MSTRNVLPDPLELAYASGLVRGLLLGAAIGLAVATIAAALAWWYVLGSEPAHGVRLMAALPVLAWLRPQPPRREPADGIEAEACSAVQRTERALFTFMTVVALCWAAAVVGLLAGVRP